MTTTSESDQLPECRKCQRRAGLSGGVCARCMGEHHGYSEEEITTLDRALTALYHQAVREGWAGQKSKARTTIPPPPPDRTRR
jgi:hypothetical protein